MDAAIAIGFSNNIYDNPADVVDSVRMISEHFQVIEIELAEAAQPAVLEVSPAAYEGIVRELRDLAVARGLHYCVHAPWHGPHTDLTARDIQERRASVALLARTVRFAGDICASIVTCHPGLKHRQREEALVENLVDSIQQLEELLSATSVTLCVENMGAERPAFSLLNIESQLELCSRVRTSVCLDAVHLASVFPESAELLRAATALAPVVKHVHLGDMVRPFHRHLPIGMGNLPLESLLQTLAAEGFRGQAIVEEFTKGWTAEQYLVGALAFRDRARALEFAN